MNIDSRFLARLDSSDTLTVFIDGESVLAKPNDTVAAVMLSHTGAAMRHSDKGSARSAYCMMGVCFDCLVEVDGCPNTQACMVVVQEGMVIKRQVGRRRLNAQSDVAGDVESDNHE